MNSIDSDVLLVHTSSTSTNILIKLLFTVRQTYIWATYLPLICHWIGMELLFLHVAGMCRAFDMCQAVICNMSCNGSADTFPL